MSTAQRDTRGIAVLRVLMAISIACLLIAITTGPAHRVADLGFIAVDLLVLYFTRRL